MPANQFDTARVVEAFESHLKTLDPKGTRLSSYEDAEELGRRAAESLVGTAELWEEHLGPFYDSAGIRHLLRRGEPLTRQAVAKRRDLLSLKTGSGRRVFPAFQFRGRNPIEGLGAVLRVLPESRVSRWTVASWLITPSMDLNHATPLECLKDGSIKPVVDAAKRWASNLAA